MGHTDRCRNHLTEAKCASVAIIDLLLVCETMLHHAYSSPSSWWHQNFCEYNEFTFFCLLPCPNAALSGCLSQCLAMSTAALTAKSILSASAFDASPPFNFSTCMEGASPSISAMTDTHDTSVSSDGSVQSRSASSPGASSSFTTTPSSVSLAT